MSFQIKKFSSILASLINWISGATDKINDFNPGSVIRTILEAFAMELEELYYQLLLATQEAIEEAIYRTFNFPRNPAISATGSVRFYRLTGSDVAVTVPLGTIVATDTEPPVLFATQSEGVMPVLTTLYGIIYGGGSATTLIDSSRDFVVDGVILGSTVINITEGGQTQPSGVTAITTTFTSNDTLEFVALTNGVSFAVGDYYKVIIPYCDITVSALVSGVGGNVSANSITVLQSNVPNVSEVSNLSSFSTGQDLETDLHRKSRFALYIQSLARATKGALEYAALSIEQIVAAKAIDDVRPTVFIFDANTAVFSDITQAMRNPGDADIKLFPTSTKTNTCLYIGGVELFEYINMHLEVLGVIAVNNLVYEYYKSNGNWGTLSVTDGTNAGTGPLTKSGTISWTPPADWVSCEINEKVRLWVRLRITTLGVIYSTIPTGDWCSLPPGLGYVFLYCHDGSGELSSQLQTMVENVVDLYRGCGIIVEVREPAKVTPTITAQVTVASNYDTDAIGLQVVQAIVDFLNAKILGEDLYVAELYQLIMDLNNKAIINTIISVPTVDIMVPSSSVLRADPDLVTITTVQL